MNNTPIELQTEQENNNALFKDDQFNGTSPEISNICAQNQQLISENTVLKSQLDRALEFQNEIKEKQKELLDEKTKLTEKNLELEQESIQLTKRLQSSQKKCQDLEGQLSKFQTCAKKLEEENKEYLSKISSLDNENTKITEKLESLQSNSNDRKQDQKAFLLVISKIFDQNFSNIDEAVPFLQNVKKDLQRLSEQDTYRELQNQLAADLENTKIINEKLLKKNEKYKKKIQIITQKSEENEKANQKELTDLTTNQKEFEKQHESLIKQNEELSEQLISYKKTIEMLNNRLNQTQIDHESEIKKCREISNSKDKRITELKKLLENPLRSESNQSQEIIKELSRTKLELGDLEIKLSDSKNLNENLKSKLSKAIIKIKKLKSEKDQMKNQFENISKKRNTNDEIISQYSIKNSELLNENDQLHIEIDNLKTQLKAALASHVEGESAWNSKAQEVIRLQSSINSVDSLIDRQREEIAHQNEQKKMMVELIHKMNQTVLNLDALLNDEIKKNQDLTSQVKRLTKTIQKNQENGEYGVNYSRLINYIKDFAYERFDEKLRFSFIQILNDDSLNLIDKMKKIFEALDGSFKEMDDKIQALSNEYSNFRNENQSTRMKNEQLSTVINSILSSFRRVLGGDPNQAMSDFISVQSTKLEMSLRNKDKEKEKNNNSISRAKNLQNSDINLDFLFEGTIEERKSQIEDLLKSGVDSDTAFEIFALQALSNIELNNQLERLRSVTEEQDEQINQIFECIGSNDLSKISSTMKNLKTENRKLQKVHKKFLADNPTISSLEKQVNKLKDETSALRDNLKTVVNDATILQNELDLKTSQFKSLENAHTQLMRESSDLQSKHLEEVNEFENIIDERNRQIRELTLKYTQLESESSDQIEMLKKSNEQLRNLNKNRTSQFKKTISLLQEKKRNREEQLAARIKNAEVHHKEEIEQYQSDIESLKKKMISNSEENLKQTSEKDELNKRLSESLRKSEERNQKMTNELSKLSIANKTLEGQMKTMQDQMKRETQLLKTQFTFDTMKNETQFQEKLANLKTSMMKEKNELVFLVLSEFDEINDFESSEIIDDASFKNTIQRIGEEYRKQKASNQTC